MKASKKDFNGFLGMLNVNNICMIEYEMIRFRHVDAQFDHRSAKGKACKGPVYSQTTDQSSTLQWRRQGRQVDNIKAGITC